MKSYLREVLMLLTIYQIRAIEGSMNKPSIADKYFFETVLKSVHLAIHEHEVRSESLVSLGGPNRARAESRKVL